LVSFYFFVFPTSLHEFWFFPFELEFNKAIIIFYSF
jgi:hypothetical protein